MKQFSKLSIFLLVFSLPIIIFIFDRILLLNISLIIQPYFNTYTFALLLFILVSIALMFVKKDESEQKNDKFETFFVSISLFFYKYITLSVALLTIFFLISVFINTYELFIIMHKELHYTLRVIQWLFYALFGITIVSSMLLFFHNHQNPDYIYNLNNTKTCYEEENRLNLSGHGKIYSSDIYLLALMLIIFSSIKIICEHNEELYFYVFSIGIGLYGFWFKVKNITKRMHIIRNSWYAFVFLILNVLIALYANTIMIQSYHLIKDIVKATDTYNSTKTKIESLIFEIRQIQNNIETIRNSLDQITKASNSLKAINQPLIKDMQAFENSIVKLEEKISAIKQGSLNPTIFKDLYMLMSEIRININFLIKDFDILTISLEDKKELMKQEIILIKTSLNNIDKSYIIISDILNKHEFETSELTFQQCKLLPCQKN